MTCVNPQIDALGDPPRDLHGLIRWAGMLQDELISQIADERKFLPDDFIGFVWGCGFSNNLPPGFMLCDGRALDRTIFADLFSKFGTAFGAGNGSTTFNIPDLRDRIVIGRGNMGGVDAGRIANYNTNTVGLSGGVATITQSVNTMAAHTHRWGYSTGTRATTKTPTATTTWAGAAADAWAVFMINRQDEYTYGAVNKYMKYEGGNVPMDVINPFTAMYRVVYTGVL